MENGEPISFMHLSSENVTVYKIDHLDFIIVLGIMFNNSPRYTKTLENSWIMLFQGSILITFMDTDITLTFLCVLIWQPAKFVYSFQIHQENIDSTLNPFDNHGRLFIFHLLENDWFFWHYLG